MQQISSLPELSRNKTPSGPNSERSELIGFPTDEINCERKGTKYKSVTYRYVGVKLAHLSVFDLYAFKRQLADYTARGNSFSKAFFGALKPVRLGLFCCFAADDAAAIGGLKEYNHASKALIGGCCCKHLFRKRKRAGGKFQ